MHISFRRGLLKTKTYAIRLFKRAPERRLIPGSGPGKRVRDRENSEMPNGRSLMKLGVEITGARLPIAKQVS